MPNEQSQQFTYTCPSCRAELEAERSNSGDAVDCTACGQNVASSATTELVANGTTDQRTA